MSEPSSDPSPVACIWCHSLNVLVVFATTTVAAMHCLGCDRPFTVEVAPAYSRPPQGKTS
jgi:hypothetical protein